MSPYIVRLGPVRERKRQPEQVPANGALGDVPIAVELCRADVAGMNVALNRYRGRERMAAA